MSIQEYGDSVKCNKNDGHIRYMIEKLKANAEDVLPKNSKYVIRGRNGVSNFNIAWYSAFRNDVNLFAEKNPA